MWLACVIRTLLTIDLLLVIVVAYYSAKNINAGPYLSQRDADREAASILALSVCSAVTLLALIWS